MSDLVSILFPCYNAEAYIKYALESILQQDHKNLQIICINDGSLDATGSILNMYKEKDHRILILNNENNIGLIASLNKALPYIKGAYFARMDADDYSVPDRITKQLNFLYKNPDTDLVSSSYNYFVQDGETGQYIPPIAFQPKAIKFLSLFATPMAHASVFARTRIIGPEKYIYNGSFPYAEDFELFSRLAWEGCRMATMKESLYHVRINPSSVSVKYSSVQVETNVKIVSRNLTVFLGCTPPMNRIVKIIANKIDCRVSFGDIREAFKLLTTYYEIADRKLNFGKQDIVEIKKYLLVHKLNCLIQANKFRFANTGFRNVFFLLSCLLLVNFQQYKLLATKFSDHLKLFRKRV